MQDGSLYYKALDLDHLTEKWRTVNSLFIHMLEIQIFFLNLSSAVWPPNSCAWGFPLCVIVLHGELKSSSGWKSSLVPHFFKFNKPTHSPNEKGSTGIFGKISWGESVKQDTKISGKSYFGASNSQISLCVELAKTEQMAKKDYWQQ